jgi:hypothetical protein
MDGHLLTASREDVVYSNETQNRAPAGILVWGLDSCNNRELMLVLDVR